MSYLSMMTDQEIEYVCSVIPLQETIAYFKYYSKDFAKVRPGFRATSFRNQEQASDLLFRKRNQRFISSFIENHIKHWLDDISEVINQKIDEGLSKESALLQTLPYCYFVDNIRLYFKLIGVEYSDETLCVFETGIKIIKESNSENEHLKVAIQEKRQKSNV
jgi:hypothetical protein